MFGFAGAFRRSELAALDVGDIVAHEHDGLHIHVRRQKNDPEGRGQIKALPYGAKPSTCPVCAYLDWRDVLDAFDAGGTGAVRRLLEHEPTATSHRCRSTAAAALAALPLTRPLLRGATRHGHLTASRLTGRAIADLIKRYAQRAGLNPRLFAGHSLRAGFVTQAARNKSSTREIMRQTGHQSAAMVDAYVREANPLADNAVSDLGL